MFWSEGEHLCIGVGQVVSGGSFSGVVVVCLARVVPSKSPRGEDTFYLALYMY